MIGQSIGHYEITAKLGQGGMGEVYRARDTRLNRDVALKLLPEIFAADEQRMGRFSREAQVLASLNHPNIASIYGIERVPGAGSRDADRQSPTSSLEPLAVGSTPKTPDLNPQSINCLVMELVEGEDLSERIARGPIPLEEALPMALQIAEALENAHEKGIIHRDLKPANIKLTPEGKVKILDFGLAKALEDPVSASQSTQGLSQSPTLTMAATQAGIILGTAAYMSPEQARGKPVDRRADIWAFGVVLWEMLTGCPVFQGEDVSQILAFVISRDPDWSRVPAATPEDIQGVLKRCLRRDPRRRVQAMGDVRIAIEEYLADPLASRAGSAPGRIAPRSSTRKLLLVAAGLMLAAVVILAWGLKPGLSTAPSTSRFRLAIPSDQALAYSGRHQVALSPDGQHLVYVTVNHIYHRAMDQLEAVQIAGTLEGGGRSPFFSPDGKWVGFWAGGELRKVPLTGGNPETLCQAENPYGASWATDERILFGQGTGGIFEVSASGGEKKLLIEVDSAAGEVAHGPQLLPGGREVLFTLGVRANWDQARIMVQSLETGERKVVVNAGKDARYLPSGHLVYYWRSQLWAVPFDIDHLESTGSAIPVIEEISEAGSGFTGAVHFSPSQSGSLVYIPGFAGSIISAPTWIDRTGQEEILAEPNQFYQHSRLSPDGERVVLSITEASGSDIWVHDLKSLKWTRLTFEGVNRYPIFAPDGATVVFTSSRDGESGLYRMAADGTGKAERLTMESALPQIPGAFAPDGKTLVFHQLASETSIDLFQLSLDSDGTIRPLLNSRFDEKEPAISPDGCWIAYASRELGRNEVFVRPFPNVDGGRWQISSQGGEDPLWGPQGSELFYLSGDNLMVSTIDAADTVSPGVPRKVVELPRRIQDQSSDWTSDVDISPDGQRFLIIKNVSDTGNQAELIVVLNWFEELNRLVPTE